MTPSLLDAQRQRCIAKSFAVQNISFANKNSNNGSIQAPSLSSGFDSQVDIIKFNRKGDLFAACGFDGNIRVYDFDETLSKLMPRTRFGSFILTAFSSS